jgi:hypothetical protein
MSSLEDDSLGRGKSYQHESELPADTATSDSTNPFPEVGKVKALKFFFEGLGKNAKEQHQPHVIPAHHPAGLPIEDHSEKDFQELAATAAKYAKSSFKSAALKVNRVVKNVKIVALEKLKEIKAAAIKPSYSTTMQPFRESGLSSPNLVGEDAPINSETVFQDTFRDKMGKVVLQEKAVRVDTIAIRIKGIENRRDALIHQLKGLKPGSQEHIKLAEDLAGVEEEWDKCKKATEGASWGSTNSPRYAFKAGRKFAKEDNSHVLCNLRMQTVTTERGLVSAVSRSAAISDFAHGEVSYQELKDYQLLKSNPKHPCGALYRPQQIDDFLRNTKMKALTGYGERLVADNKLTPALKAVFAKLDNNQSLSIEDLHILNHTEIDEVKLSAVLGSRMQKLETLALQDLYIHLKTTPAQSETMLYGRTSLLDLTKPLTNDFGCVLHERSQALDMKAVFENLQGRQISFDLKGGDNGPYIDEKGVIHMPADFTHGANPVRLDTYFINISVQGNTLNQGLQRHINERAIEKFKLMVPSSRSNRSSYSCTLPNQEALKILMNGLKSLENSESQDPFEIAMQSVKFIASLNGYSGLNCFGGKDRTGYVTALLTHSFLPQSDKTALTAWGFQLLGKGGIASRIAQQNADHKMLKVERFSLRLYNTKSAAGLFNRISDLFFSGIKALQGKALKMLSESESSGQLHQRNARMKDKGQR